MGSRIYEGGRGRRKDGEGKEGGGEDGVKERKGRKGKRRSGLRPHALFFSTRNDGYACSVMPFFAYAYTDTSAMPALARVATYATCKAVRHVRKNE